MTTTCHPPIPLNIQIPLGGTSGRISLSHTLSLVCPALSAYTRINILLSLPKLLEGDLVLTHIDLQHREAFRLGFVVPVECDGVSMHQSKLIPRQRNLPLLLLVGLVQVYQLVQIRKFQT